MEPVSLWSFVERPQSPPSAAPLQDQPPGSLDLHVTSADDPWVLPALEDSCSLASPLAIVAYLVQAQILTMAVGNRENTALGTAGGCGGTRVLDRA